MPSFPRPAASLLRVLLLLSLLALMTACGSVPKRSPPTVEPPTVSCEERTPAEDPAPIPGLPAEDAGLDAWKAAARKALASALAWAGIAERELDKRVTTAECLDGLRDSGVIR